MIAAALSPMVFVLALVCLMVWTIHNMFTQPPASVEHTPLMPDAQNVSVQQTSNPEGKVITYQTSTAPADVYTFYEDLLVKDGWGGKGYFSKPQLTTGGMIFEWDETGPNGCEELGYTLHVAAEQTDQGTTSVRLELAKINPC
jgi:hypothetical protein